MIRLLPIVVAVVLGHADVLSAQECYQPIQTISAPGGRVLDVAVDGDRAALSVQYDNSQNLVRGFIYERMNGVWVQQATLTSPTSNTEGELIALDGDLVAKSTWRGDVEVYRRQANGNWSHEMTFDMAAVSYGQLTPVTVHNNVIAVGTPTDTEAGYVAGAVHIFRKRGDSWHRTEKILYPKAVDRGFFGSSVVFTDGQLAVGANENYPLKGTIYLLGFDGVQWNVEATLPPLNSVMEVGECLAHDNNTLCVGAQGGATYGEIWVYRRTNEGAWVADGILSIPYAPWRGRFGESVTIKDDVVIAGTRDGSHFELLSGSAQVFRRTAGTWNYEGKVWPPVPTFYNEFGRNLVLADNELFVTEAAGIMLEGPGVAHIYQLQIAVGDDCNNNGMPDDCGPDIDCNNNGIADICDIAAGAIDCDGNLVLDECEIAGGLTDCNENGITDLCEIANGLVIDCNYNDLPDECESIAIDCGADNDTNHCLTNDYRLDRTLEFVNWERTREPSDSLWLNHFTVKAGAEIINSVSIYVESINDDNPVTLLVYDDPNNDGDPTDGILLSRRDVVMYAGFTWNRFPIDATFVGEAGDSFFVAAIVTLTKDTYPKFRHIFEWRSETVTGSWWGIGGAGEVDVEKLTGFSTRPLTPIGVGDDTWPHGFWLIRADATHYEGVPTVCMCPGNISTGGGGNGGLRGDAGVVDVNDLFALLANWGACAQPCAPFCAGDISGAHGLPDCAVDMYDLNAVLAAWGECEQR